MFLGIPILNYSQIDSIDRINLYSGFDKIIGIENSGLFNGVVYKERHRMLDAKQKFFHSPLFSKGTIDYDGQQYFDVMMKYDVYEDKVIIKLNNELVLDKDKIDFFSINGHSFEKMDFITTDKVRYNGFFEKLEEHLSFSFIKKHKKAELKKMGKSAVYYEFVDKDELFLLYQEKFYRVETRSDIIKIFPFLSEEIKKRFPRSYRKMSQEEYLRGILKEVFLMVGQDHNKTIE